MSGSLFEKSSSQGEHDVTYDEPLQTPDSEIPDGGTVAWLQVFGSFLLFVNAW